MILRFFLLCVFAKQTMAVPRGTIPADFAPFDDPKVKKSQQQAARISFKAFNAVALKLLGNLLIKYPKEQVLRFFKTELEKMAEDPTKYTVPGITFLKEIRVSTKYVDPSGNPIQFADLIVAKDERALQEPIPIAFLNATGLSHKYSAMTEEERAIVWDSLRRLVELAVKGFTASQGSTDEVNDLGRKIVAAAIAGGCKTIEEVAAVPEVIASAQNLIKKAK